MSEGGGGVLREILARFGFSVDDSKLKKTDDAISGLIGKVKSFAGAIASGAFFVTMKHWVDQTAAAGKEIRNSAIALGVSTRDLQEWRYVAGKAGVDASALSMGFGLLQRKALEASRGGEGAKMFRRLGIEVKTTSGELKTPAQLFEEVGFAIAGMENSTERTGTALEFFGRAGRQFVPIFAQGRDAVSAMRAELEEFGALLTDEELAALKEYGGAVAKVKTIWEGFHHQVVFAVLPVFTRLASGVLAIAKTLSRLTRGTHVVEVALGLMGAAAIAAGLKMVAAWAVPLLTVALIVAGIAALIVLLDDLWVTWEGGDSVTRILIDQAFGAGATAAAVERLKTAFDFLRTGVAAFGDPALGRPFDGWTTALWVLIGPIMGAISGFRMLGIAIATAANTGIDAINRLITAYNQIHVTGVDRFLFPFMNAIPQGLPTLQHIPTMPGPAASPTIQSRNSMLSGGAIGGGNMGLGSGWTSQTNVTVNASSADAQKVAAIVRREQGAASQRAVDDARAALGRFGGVAGR